MVVGEELEVFFVDICLHMGVVLSHVSEGNDLALDALDFSSGATVSVYSRPSKSAG